MEDIALGMWIGASVLLKIAIVYYIAQGIKADVKRYREKKAAIHKAKVLTTKEVEEGRSNAYDYLELESERNRRINIIAQNGNTGEHYEEE